MGTEEADAFFGDFCKFEETDHLEALMVDKRGISLDPAWRKGVCLH